MPILIDRQRRLARIGEIRVGDEKPEKGPGRPRTTFRFTSRFKHLLEKIQAEHGGTISQWSGQWQLLSECSTLPALFSLNRLMDGDRESLRQSFEFRDKDSGKLLRVCDGQSCKTWSGKDRCFVECLCAKEGEQRCKVHSRVLVMLPCVPDFGCWELKTGSQVFDSEANAFVANMESLGIAGIVPVVLTLTKRHKETAPGQKSGSFPVVTISRDHHPKPLAALANEIRAQLAAPVPGSLGELPVAAPALPSSVADAVAPAHVSDDEWARSVLGDHGLRDFNSWADGNHLNANDFIKFARSKGIADMDQFWQGAERWLAHVTSQKETQNA